MLAKAIPPDVTARLRAILEIAASTGLDEGALEEVRSVAPEIAGEVLASAILEELLDPTASGDAIRAVHLAAGSQLTNAVPALVRCIEDLPEGHPLRDAALAALPRFGAAAIDASLAALERCTTPDEREELAEALSRMSREDARVRAIFVGMLHDEPATAARHLAERGEWRAAADLSRALDRLFEAPVADCELCHVEDLLAVVRAIRALGGTLTDEQRRRLDDAIERADRLWIPFESTSPAPAPARRTSRLGRNAPCHCGSGRKYKNCHLDEDARRARQ